MKLTAGRHPAGEITKSPELKLSGIIRQGGEFEILNYLISGNTNNRGEELSGQFSIKSKRFIGLSDDGTASDQSLICGCQDLGVSKKYADYYIQPYTHGVGRMRIASLIVLLNN